MLISSSISLMFIEAEIKLFQRFEDALEVRLAGVKAAKAKLEEQMSRDE